VFLRERAELLCLAIKNTTRHCGRLLSAAHAGKGLPSCPPPRSTTTSTRFAFIMRRLGLVGRLDPPAPQPKAKGPVAPNTPVVRNAVFKNTPCSPLHSVVESLAADGAVTQALTHSLDSTVAHLPDLFRSAGPPAPVAAVQKTAPAKAAKPTLLGKVQIPTGFIPGCWQPLGRWDNGGRALAQVVSPILLCPIVRAAFLSIAEGWQACPQCFIIEANRRISVLFRLVLCASLTEDRYGVVQRDIPRILEALLVFLTSHGS
jgi:nucleoporin NDC1